jgi:hypothetical protein
MTPQTTTTGHANQTAAKAAAMAVVTEVTVVMAGSSPMERWKRTTTLGPSVDALTPSPSSGRRGESLEPQPSPPATVTV